jgi:hypothetical protein
VRFNKPRQDLSGWALFTFTKNDALGGGGVFAPDTQFSQAEVISP